MARFGRSFPQGTQRFNRPLATTSVTNYVRSATDSIGLTDTISRVATAQRTGADTTTASDAPTRQQSSLRTESDTTTVAETIGGAKTMIRTIVEPLAIMSNTFTGQLGTVNSGPGNITPGAPDQVVFSGGVAAISDSVVRAAIAFIRTSVDAVNLATTSIVAILIHSGQLVRSATDTITSSDSAGRILGAARTAGDAAAIGTDALVRASIAFIRTVTNTLTTSVQLGRVVNLSRAFVEAITTSDTIARIQAAVRTASESQQATFTGQLGTLNSGPDNVMPGGVDQAIGDAVTATKPNVLSRVLADTTATVDSLLRAGLVLIRTLTDTTTASDAVSRLIQSFRSAIDASSIVDAVTRILNKLRTAADTIPGPADTAAGQKIQQIRTVSDTVTTSDSIATAPRVFPRGAFDDASAPTFDGLVRVLSLTRSAGTAIPIGSDGPEVHHLLAALNETTTVSDSVSIFSPGKPTGVSIRTRYRQTPPRVRVDHS